MIRRHSRLRPHDHRPQWSVRDGWRPVGNRRPATGLVDTCGGGDRVQVVLQEPAPGRVVVSLDGELDMATGPALIDAVAQVVDRGAIRQLVVDLDNLEFLDSSGVHALVRVREMAVKSSAAFEVHRPGTMVAHVLSVAGVSDLLRVVPAEGSPAPSPRGSRPRVAER